MAKMSTFQRGFEPGAVMKNVPIVQHNPGRVFWVGNSATLVEGEIAASDSNKGGYYTPFSTIDYAIGLCKANRNDIIFVRPNHTLSIANATTLVPDIAGVQIIGLGNGENRPTITFATATAANIPVSGANTRISNMIFKCNIASQAAMITTTADGVLIDNCSFREGSATGLNFITIGAADNDSDYVRVAQCDFYMPTAGNGDHAIEILADMIGVVIEDCDIDGDFDEGGILVPTAGDAQVNLQILRCNIKNRLTNVGAIDIDGTASSGIIQDCLLRTDTQATALDSGSLAVDNVRWADETDQVSASVSVLAPADSVSNALGVDDADNAFASTNVTANRDGSILERLEAIYAAQVDDVAGNLIGFDDADNVAATTSVTANRDGSILERLEAIYAAQVDDVAANALGIDDADNVFSSSSVVANLDGSVLERLEALMDPLGGYDPVLGFRVTKTSDRTSASGLDNIFTVTGRCLITHLSGEVTTQIGTTTTIKISDITNSVDLCAATTVTGDVVGTMYHLDGVKSAVLNSGIAPVVGSTSLANGGYQPIIVGGTQGAITLQEAGDQVGTGAVAWVLYYKPLVASATVVAAA